MKKTIIFLFVCFFAWMSVNAQRDLGLGTVLIGGSSSGRLDVGIITSSTNSDPNIDVGINFYPEIGVFLFNGFCLGADLGIGYSTYIYTGTDDVSTSFNLGIGPFVRYYFPTPKIKPFIGVGFGFSNNTSKFTAGPGSSSTDYDYSSSAYNLGLEPGLAFILKDKAALNLILDLNSSFRNPSSSFSATTNTNVAIKVGFDILL